MKPLLWWVVLTSLVLLGPAAWAEEAEPVEIVYFYEVGCPDCAHVESVLEELEQFYPELTVRKYDIHSPAGRSLVQRLISAYEAELGPVPMLFAGDVAMIGPTFYGLDPEPTDYRGPSRDFALEDAIELAIQERAPSPLERLPDTATDLILFTVEDDERSERLEKLAMDLVENFPRLGIQQLDMAEPDNQRTFTRLQRLHEAPGEPPGLFVGDVALVGDTLYVRRESPREFAFGEEELGVLESKVGQAVDQELASPLQRLQLREQLTLWAVVGAALLDSLNPCDFALMLLLMGTLIVLGKRLKVLWAGLAFIAGVYVTYFTMGFVVYSLLGLTVGARGFRVPFLYAVSSLAILIGLWQMKDLLWYGKWFSIEVPERWKPRATKLAASVASIPGAFIIGSLESLFLAPCTSGPYLAILTLLSQTTERMEGALLLVLYNFVFVVPLIVLAVAVHFGFTTTARAERWRAAKAGKLHFITGLVMFVLGSGMIAAVRLGLL
ncbi:MAG: cytochrome c biogenesis protein [Candidatus Bipolaricaulota bacterium]